MNKKIVIVSAVRTPIGSFFGGLSTVSAPRLGAAAIKGALDKIRLESNLVDEVFCGRLPVVVVTHVGYTEVAVVVSSVIAVLVAFVAVVADG